MRRLVFLLLFIPASNLSAEIRPQAHFNLQGQGGIRDMAAPETLENLASGSSLPALQRQGSPKITTESTPPSRRQVYDSVIKFESDDQCYRTNQNLIQGDHFVVEAWAHAATADDPGIHTVLANGTGANGFLLCQHGAEWQVYIGGIGPTTLGKVEAGQWTHLAIVKQNGQSSGWLNGKKVTDVPSLGGGAANFSVGASAPHKECFHGWIAEVRYATFAKDKFDPASDFLMDGTKLKAIAAEESAEQRRWIDNLAAVRGVQNVTEFSESSAQTDWLLEEPKTKSHIQFQKSTDGTSARLMLSNGLVSRSFLIRDGNIGCYSLRRSDKDLEFIRSIKPEARISLDGQWLAIGGLTGMPDRAFISPQWFDRLESAQHAFVLSGMTIDGCHKPYEWSPKCNAPPDIAWPAKGTRLTLHFRAPEGGTAVGIEVDVSYELYDGIPVIMKTLQVHNRSKKEVLVSKFEGEHLAVQPSNSSMLHAESDYSFALANFREDSSGLGIHANGARTVYKDYYLGGGTTRFLRDHEWGSMATLNPAEDMFLDQPENALLLSTPPTGPNQALKPGETFDAFRTFLILHDSTDRERKGLAQRRFYRKLAPQTNEKMFEVHAPYSRDLKTLAPLMDQMHEIGFDQLQAPEHPGGFNYADNSEENIRSMKIICDYAKKHNIRVGAYQLMMASQGWGGAKDNFNCIDPTNKKPGSAFGQSACGASAWADMYFRNMWDTIEKTGMGAFKPDGPYHGDPCAATDHPHHRGLEDSQWAQWKWMCKVLAEGQRRNLYLTIPDWYFLNGQVCTGMGYREATDLIDVTLQTVIYRQYIFDATFHKTAQMGWVNLNTEVLHGGMEKNLDQYERIFFTMLSSGAQVWVRGHRLYDGPQSLAMLKKWMKWYHEHKEVILGDIIHLRRPDGRGLDYILHVNPKGREKGMLLVFNPLATPVTQQLTIPLYYTGLIDKATVRDAQGKRTAHALDSQRQLTLAVSMPANGYSWFIIE